MPERLTALESDVSPALFRNSAWNLFLEHPFAVPYLHHHARPRIEPEVVDLAHVDRTVGDLEILRILEGVAECAPELDRSRPRGPERYGNRVGELQARIPGIRAERSHAAGAVRSFVEPDVLLGALLCRVRLGQLARDDHRAGRHERAFDVLAADAQEVVVGDAMIEVKPALVAVLDERARRQRRRRP